MKIFYLSRIDVGTEDAGTRHVWEFCQNFSRLGHEITLFIPDMGYKRSLDGVSIVYIPCPIKKTSATFLSFYFFTAFYFIYFYFKNRPDVIYTRHQPMEWMTVWLKIIFNVIYVAEVNGLASVELEINKFPAWYISIIHYMDKFCFYLSDFIVTPSSIIKDSLQENFELSPGKFLVVSNGADPEVFHPMDKVSCREKLGLDLECKLMVFAGSLKKWHGIEKIIGIIPDLKKKVSEVKLIIVGDGEKKEEIERLVDKLNLKNDVYMAGLVPFEDVPFYLNAADIALAPYFVPEIDKTGISPLKIYEYMACAKPVISNPVGGLDKLFNDHEIGVLIDSSQPLDWVDPIGNLLNDPEKIEFYGNNGRSAVLTEFSWKGVCKNIEAFLQQENI